MPLLEKEIIAPGDYHTPDGIVRATPKRIRWWLKQFKRMKAKGLPVPVPWEHQEGAKPSQQAWLAAQAKYNAGHVDDMFLDKDGVLWGVLDIGSDEDAQNARDNVRYVSPEIDDKWTDGDGETWKDIITHVALTPRPVHYRQKPFGFKAQLSHAPVVQLSMADRLGSPERTGLKLYAQLIAHLAADDPQQQLSANSIDEPAFDTEEEGLVQLCNDLAGNTIDEDSLDTEEEDRPPRLQGRIRRLAKPDGEGSGRLAFDPTEPRDPAGQWTAAEKKIFKRDYREKRRLPAKMTNRLWSHVVRLPLNRHTEKLIDHANAATNLLPGVDPDRKHRAALQKVRSEAFSAHRRMQGAGPEGDEDEESHAANMRRVRAMAALAHKADRRLAELEDHEGRPPEEGGYPASGRPPRLGHIRRVKPWVRPGPTPERSREVIAEVLANVPWLN